MSPTSLFQVVHQVDFSVVLMRNLEVGFQPLYHFALICSPVTLRRRDCTCQTALVGKLRGMNNKILSQDEDDCVPIT